jgi:hypothetical protein
MTNRTSFESVLDGDQLSQGYFNGIYTILNGVQGVHTTGISIQTADFSTSNTSYTDVTDPATLTLTTTRTCTILAIAVLQTDNAGGTMYGKLVIDGTAQRGVAISTGTGKQMILIGRKTGVTAGSIAIKAQVCVSAGTITVNYDNTANQEQGSWILAVAIAE